MSSDQDPSSPQDEFCIFCGTKVRGSGNFCPNCGQLKPSLRERPWAHGTPPPIPYYHGDPYGRPPVRRRPSWRAVVKTVLAFGMFTFLVQLAIMLYSLLYGIQIVMPEITDHSYRLYVVAPILVEIGSLSGDALGAYYLLLVAAIVMSAAWVFLRGAKGYYTELAMKAEPRRHSQIFDLCALMFAVLFLNLIVVLLTGVLGEEPASPVEEVETWELLFLLANASVWEELVVRVLLIGIPLLFIDLVRRMPRDRLYRYLLGGGFRFGSPEVVLVIFSSVLFGFGHFEGWGAWKVFPAAVAGVAFGYMFLKHGLASAILLHFAFDYLSIPIELFADSSDMGAWMILGLAILIWIAMGAAFFVYYLSRIAEFLMRTEILNDPPHAPPRYAAPYGPGAAVRTWGHSGHTGDAQVPQATYPAMGGPGGRPAGPGGLFVCPKCGNTEARWLDTGKFQCLNCGALV